jgi:hypothetical protein
VSTEIEIWEIQHIFATHKIPIATLCLHLK